MGQKLSKFESRPESVPFESDAETIDKSSIFTFPYQIAGSSSVSTCADGMEDVSAQTDQVVSLPAFVPHQRVPEKVLENIDRSHREMHKALRASGRGTGRFAYAAFDVLRGGNLSLSSVNSFELDRVQ